MPTSWFVCQAIIPPLALLAALAVLRRREGDLGAQHWLRALMASCLAVGTTTHVLVVLRSGLVSAPMQPLAYNYFWSALALVDPAIAIALLFAPRVGLAAAIALMITDVAVNISASGTVDDWPIWFQAGFGLFVVAATPYVWRRTSPALVR
jgi:hypothetical protein